MLSTVRHGTWNLWYPLSLVGGVKSISFAAVTIDLSCDMYLYCHLPPAQCMTGTPQWAGCPTERWRGVYPRIGDPSPSSAWSRIKEVLRQAACQSLCWINCGVLEDWVSGSLKLFSLVGKWIPLMIFAQWLKASSNFPPSSSLSPTPPKKKKCWLTFSTTVIIPTVIYLCRQIKLQIWQGN